MVSAYVLAITLLAAIAPSAMAVYASGYTDGFFYSFWSDGGSSPLNFTNGTAGHYAITWGTGGNWVIGKGWMPGTADRIVAYTGTYAPVGNSYLAVYGWTRSPLVEYYVVENYGTYNPSSAATAKGSVWTDGGNYTILETTRTNQPSIDGTATFQQYWSVRQTKRVGGTVTMKNHFDAWATLNMTLGTEFNYQILATEGYFSSGSVDVTVTEGVLTDVPPTPTPTTPKPTTAAPTTTPVPTNANGTVPRWGQCGGANYKGDTVCAVGTCTYQNDWYSQCL